MLYQCFPVHLTHSESSSSAEVRHPVSKGSIAFGGLFTSGIKSAYDIETSGWMKLSQGARTLDVQTNTMRELMTRIQKNKLIEGYSILTLFKQWEKQYYIILTSGLYRAKDY